MDRCSTRLYGPNRFRLGLFGMNCNGGLTMTKAPVRWVESWENNVAAARLADAAGLEFLLPIGRWHGYRGETDTQGSAYETLVWAAGLLGATEGISVCGTLHVAFMNPVFAAKQMATADHIGKGRFALNIVSGWNTGEFEMFGIGFNDHAARYAYTEEWVQVVEKIWTLDEPFDHNGRFFNLKGVLGKPKPYGGGRPLLISAGASDKGRAFAARNVDCLFTSIREREAMRAEITAVRATDGCRPDLGVYCSGHTVCRPTRKEAQDYYHYIVYETGDWPAAEHAAAIRMKNREGRYTDWTALKERMISGAGTYPFVGSYDDVVEAFATLSECGVTGIALGLVNYIEEFHHLKDGLLPRLERIGLRQPFKT